MVETYRVRFAPKFQQAHYILVVPVLHYLTTCWLEKAAVNL